MKMRWDKQYTLIAVYSTVVLCCAILFYLAVVNLSVFFGWVGWILGILKPIIYAFAFAYIINPLMVFFEELIKTVFKGKETILKSKRGISVFLAYLSLVFIIVFLFSIVIPQLIGSVSNLLSNAQSYANSFETWLSSTLKSFSDNGIINESQINSVSLYINDMLNTFTKWITNQIPGMIDFTKQITIEIYNILFGLMVSIYVLLEKEKFKSQAKKMVQALLPRKAVSYITDLTEISDNMFGVFLRGKLLDSLIIGLICFLGTLILGIPYSMLISTIVGISNIIPYFGPFIGAIPSIFIILIIDPLKALWLAIFLLVLQQFDGNFLSPKILGNSVGISAFWVITSIIIGGGLFGVVGMFLAVPAFGVLSSFLRKYIRKQLKKKGYVDEGEEEVLIYEFPKD